MPARDHRDQVYSAKAATAVSWFQKHVDLSLRLLRATGVTVEGSMIGVAGGASTLVDDLLADGFTSVPVLDLSAAARSAAAARPSRCVGPLAGGGHHTKATLAAHACDVRHDRAVCHLLTAPEGGVACVQNAGRTVRPGGHVGVATLAEDGPAQGEENTRRNAAQLARPPTVTSGTHARACDVAATPPAIRLLSTPDIRPQAA
jgi:hypothetical protein